MNNLKKNDVLSPPLGGWGVELQQLRENNNFRSLPSIRHEGREVIVKGQRMLNLSSNDYLGLANDVELRKAFLETISPETLQMTSSSSRLLTGNFTAYDELESFLAAQFGTEASLVFNCGYHANTGILPAVCNDKTLILADKLVHASLIDGIRLTSARCIRYRHNQYSQLERLLEENAGAYEQVIIVTESIFSMDGDEADLTMLVDLKRKYPNVLLYVDEAHAVGVRGNKGLGCAEEKGCINDIDFLVGTFGKALASAGAYIVCRQVIRDYLINKMRPFIFTTALPPITVQWTLFVMQHLAGMQHKRKHLAKTSLQLRTALAKKGYTSPSVSQIVPMIAGASSSAIVLAEELQRKGFYALPVRPPTVPEGTARIRFSLTADITEEEVEKLTSSLSPLTPSPVGRGR
ncbi:8-amino-7-oxononanoate synthase [Bacteroides sp.]